MLRRRTVLLAVVALVALIFFVRHAREDGLGAVTSSNSAVNEEGPTLAVPELAVPRDSGSPAEVRQLADRSKSDTSAASTTRLTGRVVDRDGQAIAGASLRYGTAEELARAQLDPSAAIGSRRDLLATYTEVDGAFDLGAVSAREQSLIVGPRHRDFVAERAWTLVAPGEHPVLTMAPCARAKLVAAAYNTGTDEPISRLRVEVRVLGAPSQPAAEAETYDGWNGKLEPELTFAPGASIELRFSVPSMGVATTPELTRIVRPADGEELRLRIPVDVDHAIAPPGKSVVTGIVRDARTREPIAHATVSFVPLGSTDRTASPTNTVATAEGRSITIPMEVSRSDARGRFRLVAPQAADFELLVRASHHLATAIPVRADDDVEVLLRPAATLVLRVEDTDGAEVPDLSANIVESESTDPDAWSGPPTLDDKGWRTWSELEPGRWTLSLPRPRSLPPEALTISLELEVGVDVELHVVLDTTTWTGTWSIVESPRQ